MVNQNSYDEVLMDLYYYEDPSDEFKVSITVVVIAVVAVVVVVLPLCCIHAYECNG